jgi:hypothetical protein
MKAVVILENNEIEECEVTRNKNQVIIEFKNESNVVPFSVIRDMWKDVGIKIVLKDTEEPDCTDCDRCLTPIC